VTHDAVEDPDSEREQNGADDVPDQREVEIRERFFDVVPAFEGDVHPSDDAEQSTDQHDDDFARAAGLFELTLNQ
jgi:hypothetical protein